MWKLLKAEINYNKIYLLMGYFLYITLFIIIAIWGKIEHNLRDLSIALWAATLLGRFSGEIEKTKSKRVRYHAIMPLNIRHIAMAPLIFTIFYWISIIVLFLISLLIVKPYWLGNNTLWALLPINGLILIGYAGFSVYNDLNGSLTSNNERIILHLIRFLILIAGYFLLLFYIDFMGLFTHSELLSREAFAQLYFSRSGVIVLNLVGFVLAFLSVEVFARRRAYVE